MPTTYVIPEGLNARQKKALAALLVCAPCCSGSGTGSGGLVSYLPCSVLDSIGGATVTLDYEVTGCYDGSDAGVTPASDPCSPGSLFDVDTRQIFTPQDTRFDGHATLDAGSIQLLWCDGMQVYWVGDPAVGPADYIGNIQFAFTCYPDADGVTFYIAFYALLTLSCLPAPGGTLEWAYKTLDIAYEVGVGDDFTLSVTGLTPFASQSSGTCTCGTPTISMAINFDFP